tara:strand:- start:1085 stop:1408 length:324 start_codon:yes stop_codon:yes gene_type:complete
MTCSWCEEDNELVKLCNIDAHKVCKICYDKYRKSYPLRVEGCPYCKGNEEKIIVEIHGPEIETVTVIENHHDDFTSCNVNGLSIIIAAIFIVLLLLFFICIALDLAI